MTRILFTALFSLFCIAAAFAQEPKINISPAATESTVEHTGEKGLLWEISGNNLQTPSFLFGTIHMIDRESFFWPEGTQESLYATNRITFEIDMKEMNDFSTLFQVMFGLVMDNGTTLQDLLSKEDYTFVRNRFDELGLPIPLFLLERVQPMLLTMFTSEDFDLSSMQMGDGITSYEMELLALAEEKEMETAGLETVAYQISIFDSIPYDAQAKMLVDALKAEKTDTTVSEEDQFGAMVQAYKDQDISKLHKMIQSEEGGIADFEDHLLNNRNYNWIPIMQKMMAEKPTFFAVGAGHLGGEKGVIALLRKEGYNVTRVK